MKAIVTGWMHFKTDDIIPDGCEHGPEERLNHESQRIERSVVADEPEQPKTQPEPRRLRFKNGSWFRRRPQFRDYVLASRLYNAEFCDNTHGIRLRKAPYDATHEGWRYIGADRNRLLQQAVRGRRPSGSLVIHTE